MWIIQHPPEPHSGPHSVRLGRGVKRQPRQTGKSRLVTKTSRDRSVRGCQEPGLWRAEALSVGDEGAHLQEGAAAPQAKGRPPTVAVAASGNRQTGALMREIYVTETTTRRCGTAEEEEGGGRRKAFC